MASLGQFRSAVSASSASTHGRYDELRNVIRTKLHKPKTEMSDNDIKALWCSLDANDSNAIEKDEMAAFFKRGGDWGSMAMRALLSGVVGTLTGGLAELFPNAAASGDNSLV